MYSKIYTEEKKIPIPLAAILILFMISSLTFTLSKKFNTQIQAAKVKIMNLEVVNLTNQSACIFYQTEEKIKSWIVYGSESSNLNNVVYDERDTKSAINSYLYHYSCLKDLKSNQQIFYKVGTTEGVVGALAGGAFELVTLSDLGSLPKSAEPAIGLVLDSSGSSVVGGFVKVNVPGARPVLSLTGSTGGFVTSMLLTSIKTNEPFQTTSSTLANLEITSDSGQKSKITAPIDSLSPLPETIVLGKNYNFIKSASSVLSAQKIVPTSTFSKNKISIRLPPQNGTIPGKRPIFSGSAIAGEKVTLQVPSGITKLYEIITGADGGWSVTPKEDLNPGNHTLSMTTNGEDGKPITLKHSFTILKSGERVLGDATSSAKLTVTPTLLPSATPTIEVLPTIEVTVTKAPPVSGINFLPMAFISLIFILLGAGLMVVF